MSQAGGSLFSLFFDLVADRLGAEGLTSVLMYLKEVKGLWHCTLVVVVMVIT